jgi:hypothetical protein
MVAILPKWIYELAYVLVSINNKLCFMGGIAFLAGYFVEPAA